MPLGEEIPLERGHQRGVPPIRNRYFTTIGSSSVKTVADRHRLADPLGSRSPPYDRVKFGHPDEKCDF